MTRGLIATSIRIILDVAAHTDTTLAAIARRTAVDRHQVYMTLWRMERHGIVERLDKAPTPRGNEAWLWSLTEAGKRQLRTLRDGVLAATKEMQTHERERLPDMPGVRPERRHSLSELRPNRLE